MCCGNAGWQGQSFAPFPGSGVQRQNGCGSMADPFSGSDGFPGFGNNAGCCEGQNGSQAMNQGMIAMLFVLLGMLLGGQGNGPGGSPFGNLLGGNPFGGGGAGSPGGGFGDFGGGPSGSFGGGPVNGGQFSPGQGVSNGNALDVARSYLGVNERQHGGFIARTFSKGQRRAWCADFVSTVLNQSGGSPWGHIASVRGIHNWAAKNGRLTNNPRPGDVILLRGASGNLGHTGFVEKIENGYVHTIEGNTSDAVKRRRYRLDSREVQGFVSTGQNNRMTA